jgi:hypothetical protein
VVGAYSMDPPGRLMTEPHSRHDAFAAQRGWTLGYGLVFMPLSIFEQSRLGRKHANY